MGITEEVLSEFDIDDDHYTIELIEDSSIHIHIDGLRIVLSLEEFMELHDTIVAGNERLAEIKDIDDA